MTEETKANPQGEAQTSTQLEQGGQAPKGNTEEKIVDEGTGQAAQSQSSEEGEGELELVVEEEEVAEDDKAPKWVADLRKQYTTLQRENADLRKQIKEIQPANTAKKPRLEDYDFDAEAYETAYEEWVAKAKQQGGTEQNEVDQLTTKYLNSKGKLKFKDIESIEKVVSPQLTPLQQKLLVENSNNPALLVYALGKYPEALERIKEIQNPEKFVYNIAQFEAKMKLKKALPNPDKALPARSASGGVANADQQLNKLREEAEKTGDYTKVHAHRRASRNN